MATAKKAEPKGSAAPKKASTGVVADWLGPLKPSAPTEVPTASAGPNWSRLLELAEAADQPLTPEELALWKRGIIDGNARAWNVQYVHAASAALTQRQPAQLLAMLNAEIPAPSFLLPIIAAVIEAQAVKRGGRSPILDPTTRSFIRAEYDRVLDWQSPGLSETKRRSNVIAYFAKAFGASPKTIERALNDE